MTTVTGRRQISTRLDHDCKAPIVWAVTVAGENGPGGKAMPLDPHPSIEGNVAVRVNATHGRVLCRVLCKGETVIAGVELLAMPHFATCTARHPTKPPADTPPIGQTAPLPAVPAAPKRIQCARTPGWKLPNNTAFVGHGSRWANEFEPGSTVTLDTGGGPETFRVLSRAHGVALYRRWQAHEDASLARRELAGKDVACWCPLDQPCHGDVLLDLAAETP